MDRAQDALRRLRSVAGLSAHQAASETLVPGADLPGLTRGSVHEFFAGDWRDAAAAAGFVTALAIKLGQGRQPALWVRHPAARVGALYGGGLVSLGFDPSRLIMVPVADEKDALRAAREGLRCEGLASVVIEIAGAARHLDLSATRRLKLAAAEYGVTALILRTGADPGPSAAETRWQVAPALSVSAGLGLPGRPAWRVTLLKHRSAVTGRIWELEWDHETGSFLSKALSRPLAALPIDRAHFASGESRRAHAG